MRVRLKRLMHNPTFVIPAEAGISAGHYGLSGEIEIPAVAGMTENEIWQPCISLMHDPE